VRGLWVLLFIRNVLAIWSVRYKYGDWLLSLGSIHIASNVSQVGGKVDSDIFFENVWKRRVVYDTNISNLVGHCNFLEVVQS
jgi:hypothetical protein